MFGKLFHIIQKLLRELQSLTKEKLELLGHVLSLESEVAVLKCRIALLEGQKNKTSRNSSKPPSTDMGRKKPVKNSRTKSGKPTGGQQGNLGKTLAQTETPDEIEIHEVEFCECGEDLREQEVVKIEKRQVFEMKDLGLKVIEHQAEIKICEVCERIIKGVFPDGVKAPVQYGPKVKGSILDLNTHHFLSYQRINIFFQDWFGHSISGGLIHDSLQKGRAALNGEYKEKMTEQLLAGKIIHTDETGLYFGGKRNWLHVLSTDKLTLYHAHENRGRAAIDDMGILGKYTGRVIHDNYVSYPGYDNCKHGLCNAHHLRELLFFEEEQQAEWAFQMGVFLRSVKKDIDFCKEKEKIGLDIDDLNLYQTRYNEILKMGYDNLPPPPPPKSTKGKPPKHPQHNLLNRLMDKKEQVLAFMYDFDVPFDNNQAERDLRMVKTKQKVSGCFRSTDGAHAFASIRGYISTVKKNASDVLEALTNLMKGKPYMPSSNPNE